MKKRLILIAVLLAVAPAGLVPTQAGVRIKDITDLDGARSNQLLGFGLVIGLDGTGSKSIATQKVAVDMLQRFNVATKAISENRGDIVFKSGSISAVMVTADLGPFSRKGSRMDVLVSTLDDAASLQGGTLIYTPMKGADNVVYALAQGPISVGGFSFGVPSPGGGAPTASAQKNHPTVGRISGGAIIECEARGNILCNGAIKLLLRDADPGTARSIAKVINGKFPDSAVAVDAGAVQVFVPHRQANDLMSFVSAVTLLEVNPDTPARVVINERTGTIVAGENVKVGTAIISHGSLSISTSSEPVASQPLPFSRGKTAVLPRGQVGVAEEAGQVRVLEKTVTVGELARALNALGATPRDLITIFQGLKKAGALHAELIPM